MSISLPCKFVCTVGIKWNIDSLPHGAYGCGMDNLYQAIEQHYGARHGWKADICRKLGVTRQALHVWKTTGKFPPARVEQITQIIASDKAAPVTPAEAPI